MGTLASLETAKFMERNVSKVTYLNESAQAANSQEPLPEIVEKCRELLERAESGELRAVAFAAICRTVRDNETHWRYDYVETVGHSFALVGLMEGIKYGICQRVWDGRE